MYKKIISDHNNKETPLISRRISSKQDSKLTFMIQLLVEKYSLKYLHAKQLAIKLIGWLNKLSPAQSANVKAILLDSLVSPQERENMLNQDLSNKVMLALKTIQNEAKKLSHGTSTKLELFSVIMEQIASLGTKMQVIGWYKLVAGQHAGLTPEIKRHYEQIMTKYGELKNIFSPEDEKIFFELLGKEEFTNLLIHYGSLLKKYSIDENIAETVIHEIKSKINELQTTLGAMEEKSNCLVIVEYKAGANVEPFMINSWQQIIATNLAKDGFEPSNKKSVLNATAALGEAIWVRGVKTTNYITMQSEKAKKLKIVGIKSYVIIPIKASENPIILNEEQDAADVINRFEGWLKNSQRTYSTDIHGAVHLLIHKSEEKYPENIRRKIEAATYLISAAAQIFAGAEHTASLITMENKLVQFTQRLIGEKAAKTMHAQIVAGNDTFIKGQAESHSVMFFDIKGYTAITEAFQQAGLDNRLLELLNIFHTVAGVIITQNNGQINKFIADAVLGIFPGDKPDAVIAAITLHNDLEKLNTYIAEEFAHEIKIIQQTNPNFDLTLQLRTGINTGEISVGTVGASTSNFNMKKIIPSNNDVVFERYEPGYIGTIVNNASRLESLGSYFGYYGIIISESTKQTLGNEFVLRKLYPVKPIGAEETIPIYAVLGHNDALSKQHLKIAKLHNIAIDNLIKENFSEAKKYFSYIKQLQPKDAFATHYINKIDYINTVASTNNFFVLCLNKSHYWDALNALTSQLEQDNEKLNHFARATLKFVKINTQNTSIEMISFLDREKFDMLKEQIPQIISAFNNNDHQKLINSLNKFEQDPAATDLVAYIKNTFNQKLDLFRGDISRYLYPSKK